MNVDRYHTTNRTATCNRTVFVGARGWCGSFIIIYVCCRQGGVCMSFMNAAFKNNADQSLIWVNLVLTKSSTETLKTSR